MSFSKYFIFLSILSITLLGACTGNKEESAQQDSLFAKLDFELKGDSMLYGLACDGSSDSVIVIWPFNGDPITINSYDAKQNGRVIGKPQIGDWIGIMLNPNDTTEADMVINLDQLKGTWTYPVLPVWKDFQHMSKRMQKRMEADMPDSVKETFLIPREYGFTLKRSHQAQAVGRIMRQSSLDDDSPVQYPEVRNYREWYMLNGRLVLVSAKVPDKMESGTKLVAEADTLDFVQMDDETLTLDFHGTRYEFHRKANTFEANKEATKAQEKIDQNLNKK